ncbi:brevican core protein-like [Marmota marmota marmota]|uniref:brevican core protein-like n=1 Tax=Marmota marmota marmota TaxID=9994 RepID=UPI002092DDED|nr:brevican core protein-like [Marmota marmota marmota]
MEDGGGGSSTPEDPAEAPRTLLGCGVLSLVLNSVLGPEFETQSVVPPTGSSDEEDQMLEEEERYEDEEEAEEEEEEEAVEDEDLWAWPSEFSSPVPTEPEAEDSLSQASPPARAVLQPGASPPPEGQSETPRPPRARGPPTETLPTPREGTLASPPPSTLVGEEIEGPELPEVPRGESEETGSSEDATSLPPATQAPEATGELEAPSEEDSGRTIPAGTSVQAQPVLPTDGASRGGVAVAPSSDTPPGDFHPSSLSPHPVTPAPLLTTRDPSVLGTSTCDSHLTDPQYLLMPLQDALVTHGILWGQACFLCSLPTPFPC